MSKLGPGESTYAEVLTRITNATQLEEISWSPTKSAPPGSSMYGLSKSQDVVESYEANWRGDALRVIVAERQVEAPNRQLLETLGIGLGLAVPIRETNIYCLVKSEDGEWAQLPPTYLRRGLSGYLTDLLTATRVSADTARPFVQKVLAALPPAETADFEIVDEDGSSAPDGEASGDDPGVSEEGIKETDH